MLFASDKIAGEKLPYFFTSTLAWRLHYYLLLPKKSAHADLVKSEKVKNPHTRVYGFFVVMGCESDPRSFVGDSIFGNGSYVLFDQIFTIDYLLCRTH